ncbi:MAG: M20/M25/M40 family metallo-hydrolase [Acidobacteriia bacterium]|nr:M20/M25/M40 family metallo-hydrolase [Terriglobia bacterium]
MKRHFLTLLSFAMLLTVGSQPPVAAAVRQATSGTAAPPIRPDGKKAYEHIKFLASDAMKGRMSGTSEFRKAAEYVAGKFEELGLQPAGDKGTWFQEVELKNFREFLQPIRLEITSPGHHAYFAGYGRDFQPVSGTGSGIVKGRLAFAGYGVVSEKAGWNDYEGLDARGRIIMILAGVPTGVEAEERRQWTLEKKIKIAAEHGAVGLIEMDMTVAGQRLSTVQRPSGPIQAQDGCPAGFVVMRAGRGFCDDAFYLAGKSWRYHASKMMRAKKPCPVAIDTAALMEVHAVRDNRTAPNVIGVMPGMDAKLKDECIVFGGHLDHLGVGVDGFIYNGADDNATSIATILEVLRVLKANHFQPRRTLVFAAWMGEESGMLGSMWYTNHPVFPLEKTALYMNVDMVGTGDTDLWVGGLYEFPELFDIIRQGLDPELQKKMNARLQYKGSDHTAFDLKGVPAISLRSGYPLTPELDDKHPEYHRPGDKAEYIRLELLQEAAEYNWQIIINLSNTDKKLVDPQFFTSYIHRDATVIDMHCDTISRYMAGEDLKQDLPGGHIDIPKLKRGSVDLQVFAAYVPVPRSDTDRNTAAKRAFDQIDAMHKLISENPNDLALVLGPGEVAPLKDSNKTGVLIAIEGGYAIENDLSLLRSFYKAGVRLMTLTHWNRTDWADASGDEKAELGGLTPFGEQVVKEMNRLGMIIDVSHAHDETFWDVLRVSTKPVVASHSCARSLSDHFRNLSDEMLKALAKNGGVIGINFAPGFLNADIDKKHNEILAELAKKYGLPENPLTWDKADPVLRNKALAEARQRMSPFDGAVDVKTVVDHIDRVVKVTGSADHVGLGSDFDGIESTPKGLENIGKIGAITEELRARGYKEADIRKILGANFLRVFNAVTQDTSR